MRATRRPASRRSKHSKPILRLRENDIGNLDLVFAGFWNKTKRPPWKVRAANRIANKRARAARKANR